MSETLEFTPQEIALAEEELGDLFLFGFLVRLNKQRKHFAIAAATVERATKAAKQFVELCENRVVDDVHLETIVFLGRVDDAETFDREEYFANDQIRRGRSLMELGSELKKLLPSQQQQPENDDDE